MFKEHISSIIEDELPFMTSEELEKKAKGEKDVVKDTYIS